MGLEGVVFALSVFSTILQVFAWRWTRGIQRSLKGSIGYDLARIIANLIGWSLAARAIAMIGIVILNVNPDDTFVPLLFTSIAQATGTAIFVWAALQVYKLSRQPPFDGPSEAVAEASAETAGEVPGPAADVRSPVDDKKDLLHVNVTQGQALKTSNELLQQAIETIAGMSRLLDEKDDEIRVLKERLG